MIFFTSVFSTSQRKSSSVKPEQLFSKRSFESSSNCSISVMSVCEIRTD